MENSAAHNGAGAYSQRPKKPVVVKKMRIKSMDSNFQSGRERSGEEVGTVRHIAKMSAALSQPAVTQARDSLAAVFSFMDTAE